MDKIEGSKYTKEWTEMQIPKWKSGTSPRYKVARITIFDMFGIRYTDDVLRADRLR